jgi:hypothetical protein
MDQIVPDKVENCAPRLIMHDIDVYCDSIVLPLFNWYTLEARGREQSKALNPTI